MSKKIGVVFALLAFIFIGLIIRISPNYLSSKQRKSIVILFETDVHCNIDGYAKIAGLRDAIADTAWAALVSSGDFIQGNTYGTISRGQYIIDIMQTMNYDAIELGNHEFDYNLQVIQEHISNLKAPILCSNLSDMQGNPLFLPYIVRTYGDCKIAFVGVLTPQTELENLSAFRDENKKPIYSLHPDNYTHLVQQAVDNARSEGADYVFLLSHMGESNEDNPFTSDSLIAVTHGIDAVLDGHTHNVIKTSVNNSLGKTVPLVNTGDRFKNVGKLYISSDGKLDITLIPIEQISKINASVNEVVERVKNKVDEQTNHVVGHSDFPIYITDGNGIRLVRKAETNSGDLVADALRWFYDTDIGLVNGGSLRADIQAGSITYNDIFNLLTYDNMVWKVQVTGDIILEVLRHGVSSLPNENGGFPQISGLRFSVNSTDHSVMNVEVQQKDGTYVPLCPTSTYTVSTIDYAITGSGFNNILSECPILEYSNTLSREVLIKYIADALDGKIGEEYSSAQGRIIISD